MRKTVPGAEHTGGIDVHPAEYERRVVRFYDQSLLEERSGNHGTGRAVEQRNTSGFNLWSSDRARQTQRQPRAQKRAAISGNTRPLLLTIELVAPRLPLAASTGRE